MHTINIYGSISNLYRCFSPSGSVYDATKDYAASFYIIGAMIAVSGAMLYFIPCVRRCSEQRHAPSQHDREMGRITTNVL
jgi:hypothetical protein